MDLLFAIIVWLGGMSLFAFLAYLLQEKKQIDNKIKDDTKTDIAPGEPFHDIANTNTTSSGEICKDSEKEKSGCKNGWKCYDGNIEFKIFIHPHIEQN